LRMAELAAATDLSASRMTRLVDDLQSRGFVTKTASSSDARGNVARLTPQGMSKLKSAWPVHLATVRGRFFDCMDAAAVAGVAKALVEVAVQLGRTTSPESGSQVSSRLSRKAGSRRAQGRPRKDVPLRRRAGYPSGARAGPANPGGGADHLGRLRQSAW
jgi:MarR family